MFVSKLGFNSLKFFSGFFLVSCLTVAVTKQAYANTAPIAYDQAISVFEETPIFIDITGYDADFDALSYSLQIYPMNGYLTGEFPYLTYTPNENYNGADSFTYIVNDGLANSVPATVSITVKPINDVPKALYQDVVTNEDTSIEILLTGDDVDGDNLTFEVFTQPDHGVLNGVPPNLTYTPDSNFNGFDGLVFKVNDGTVDSSNEVVLIEIKAVNDAPVALDQAVNVYENTPIYTELTGSDIDFDPLYFFITSAPANGVLSGDAPYITYTPNANYTGSDSYSFNINDGTVDSNIATVSVNVKPLNIVPVADDQSVATTENTDANIVLTGTSDNPGTLIYQVLTQPTQGVLSGVAPNLVYSPNANYTGADSFTFSINDGVADSAEATVSITVNPVNTAPVANSQTVSAIEDTPVVISLTATDSDADTLSYSLQTQPANGVVSGTAPNLTYVPDTNFYGVDSFTFVANDGVANSIAAIVTVNVGAVNDVPVALDQNVSVSEDTPLSITLFASDIDGDILSFSLATQPANGTITGASPNLIYTPNANFTGADSFTYIANDGTVNSNTASVAITVSAVNDAPVATAQSVTTAEDTAAFIVLDGTDIDGDALTHSVVTQPANGVLSGVSPNLTYTPNENYTGADSFTFVSSDGAVNSSAASIAITITGVNDAPIALEQFVSVNEDSAIAITLSGSDIDGDALIYQVTTQPGNGVLTGTAPNLIYAPNTDFNGIDEFYFTVSDGQATSIATLIDLNVLAVNDAPIAHDQAVTMLGNTTTSIVLTGEDPENDTLTYQLVNPPLHGILSGNIPDLQYTPNTNFEGTDNFQFTVTDGSAISTDATVSVTVNGLNNAPIITSEPILVTFENQAYVYAVTAEDPDGDALSYSLTLAPAGAVFDGNTHSIVWNNPVTGSYPVELTVTDEYGLRAQQSYTLVVVEESPPVTYQGTDFWLMFNTNVSLSEEAPREPDASDILLLKALYFSSLESGVVNIEATGLGISVSIPIEANTVGSIDLTNYLTPEVIDAIGINQHGINVTSDVPIALYLLNQRLQSTDAALVLPVSALGNEYYLLSWSNEIMNPATNMGYNFGNFIGLVATEDNTIVTISPKDTIQILECPQPCDINGAAVVSEPFQITLNRGQSFQAIGIPRGPAGFSYINVELIGSHVVSDKPIAFFGGDRCAAVQQAACDHNVEQMLSIENWGTHYQTMPLAKRELGDTFRIVASSDDTYININGNWEGYLNQGEFFEIILDAPSIIRGTKPIAVAQFSNGANYDVGERPVEERKLADPFMIWVPPVEQFLAAYNVLTPTDIYQLDFVNLLVPASATDSVRIDGQPVDNNLWQAMPTPGYFGAQIPVADGQHNITADETFGIYIYGFDDYESYGYTGGMAISDHRVVDNIIVSVEGSDTGDGHSVCINAQLLDETGNPVTQTQVFFNRQALGVSIPHAALSDALGRAEWCYYGAHAGTEHITLRSQTIVRELDIDISSYINGNTAPSFISLPNMHAIPGEMYNYQVVAVDPNSDALTYQLSGGPDDMLIDSATGLIQWQTPGDFLDMQIIVTVSDGAETAEQHFLLKSPPLANHYPLFTSTPETRVISGRQYEYVMTARDVDNYYVWDLNHIFNRFAPDARTYHLLSGPVGMEYVAVSSNRNSLIWDVTDNDVGTHNVRIETRDSNGASDIQEFDLVVEPNQAPRFTTQPILNAREGSAYFYYFDAVDGNDDAITYTLLEGPEGIFLQQSTPYIHWTPGALQVGANRVVIQADDTFGGVSTHSFTIVATQNEPPQIIEQPLQTAIAGVYYRYRIEANDPNGDPLSYNFVSGPDGMSMQLDGLGAEIRWTPTSNQVGNYQATFEVSDGHGAYTTYTYSILVNANQPPVFTSVPQTSGISGHRYSYIPTSSDPDSTTLTSFSLVSGPTGMSMTSGQLSWTPTDAQVGNHVVTIETSDAYGYSTRQTYTLAIVRNTEPEFTSLPPTGAKVGVQYRFVATATDADNDGFYFEVESGPSGFSNITSIFIWTPTIDQVGTHPVTIKVTDYAGAVTLHSYTITVIDDSLAITSYPDNVILVNDEVYSFILEAIHPTDAPLTFTATQAPTGLNVDPNTGLLSWTPTFAQIGTHSVTVVASDGVDSDSVTFNLQVNENTNQAPEISSTPIESTRVDEPYSYAVIASDAENHALTYSLMLPPTGMSINNSGLVTWTPTINDVGTHNVMIRVTDERTRFVEQTYTLNVNEVNRSPVVSGVPANSAAVGYEYHQLLPVTDPDGDSLEFTVHGDTPAGVTVDPTTGMVNWTPTIDQVGQQLLSIQVSDGEASIAVSWNVTVSDVLVPIDLFVNAEPQFIQQGEVSTLTVISNGGVAQAEVSVLVDGLPVELDLQGQAILDGSIIGRHSVDVTSTDGVNTESYSTYYSVADVTDTAEPVVEIISPIGGATITAPTDVTVTVTDDNIAEVLLAYSKPNSEEFIELYRGTDLFINQVIATFDPTLLMNGMYHIILQATDINGQVSNTAVPVTVEGDLKVGNFSITLEDINIPLAGIPIRVTRTYDSRQKDELLDFGYGWSIDYQNVDIEESSEPTEGWYQERRSMSFSTGEEVFVAEGTCTYPLSNKIVTVTLPNGDVEKFNVKAVPIDGNFQNASDPNCYFSINGRYLDVIFEAATGTHSTLVSTDGLSLYLTDLNAGNLSFLGETSAVPITKYRLTTREGFIYHLNQNFGIEVVEDPNGNTLTYSDAGITHSAGKSINFNRDRDGRILTITDATGTLVSYDYNGLGDLISSVDALTNATTYSYAEGHALEEIVDPLGRRLVRNIYDLEGRLIAQEDSDGNRTDFNHNIAGRLSVVTNRRGFATQYAYDDRGNVLTEIDALYNTTQYTYDANDNQLSKTDALGNVTSATYNAEDDQLTQTDELGNTVSFTYNTRGQELTVTDAKLNVFTNTYDTYGNLLNITDPAGNVASNFIGSYGLPANVTNTLGYQTAYTYNLSGSKLTETDALGNVTSFTYDANNNLLTESRQRTDNGTLVTETTSYTYDALNRLISTTDALGNTTSTEYDAVGNKVRDIDAAGRITEYTYDAYRRLTQTTYPDASFSRKTYDAEGNLLTDTDRTGYVTTYTYDELNRLVSTSYADGTSTQIEYDAVGRVIAEIDANNNRSEFTYDAAGRRVLTRDALLNDTTFTYDEEGNLISQTDANSNTTTFEYDALDNRITTTYPDLSVSRQAYDAMGQVLSRTDQSGITTNYAYDELGRLSQVTDALLGITAYSYDEVGNKLTQTDAAASTTSWTYDALGRETSRTLPLGQSDSSSYDVHGNMISHTDFNGQLTRYLYDSHNRVERIDYNDLSAETFTYDNEGRRTSATTREGLTQSWAYDNRGRLTLDSKANGDQISYGYDSAGNRTSVVVTPSGGTADTTSYGFDTLNRLSSVTAPGAQLTSYSYDNVGNRASVTYPNGNVTSYVYDTLNRLTQQTTTLGASVLTDFTYTLDASGHRTQIIEASGRTTNYSYDNLYRLLTENITDAVNGNYSASYQYDAVGNRTYSTINGVQTAYTYDNNDRLTQQGGTTYSYDANGNTLTETLDLNVKSFSYDAKNQLVGSSAGSVTSSYAYDIDGIRSQKVENAITTDFLVDLNRDYGQVLKETTGVNTTDYVYGDDLVSQSRGGSLSYYLYDGLGSTRALSDVSGGVTDRYDYEAFGDTLNKTGTTENNYLFTGEQYDANLDNYYLRARYYNQNAGRFTQMDTYMGNNQDPVSLHKYLYGNVDPVNNIDPSGNFSIGSLMTAVNVVGRLTTIASTSYDVFSVASGDGEVTSKQLGLAILSNLAGGKVVRLVGKKTKFSFSRNKKNKKSKCKTKPNSFLEGTLVWSEFGLLPIESLKIGDNVWAFDVESGELSLEPIVHLIQGTKDEFVSIEGQGSAIKSTVNHPFRVNDDWVRASELKEVSQVKAHEGVKNIVTVKKKNVSVFKTYNLTVDNKHTYFVGKDRFLVHNSSGCSPEYGGGAHPGSLSVSTELFFQAVADALNVTITLVGSQAATGGNAKFSDWDYIVEGKVNSKVRKQLKRRLPRGPAGTGSGRGQDFLDGPVRDKDPFVRFRPR